MIKQILFSMSLLLTLGIFAWSVITYFKLFKLTKQFPIGDIPNRLIRMM